jgi:PII-like signaling protein
METGPAKKMVVYVGETDQHNGVAVYEVLLEWLHNHDVAGATVTRAIAGFGPRGAYRKPRLFHMAENVPVRIEVVDSPEKIRAILPFVYDIVGAGLIEVLDTEVIKHTVEKDTADQPAREEHVKLEGRSKMLRVYVDEDDKWEGEPLYEAIVKTLRMMDMAGATVYRGIMGYGAQHRVHRSGFLGISRNLPVMITTVDTEEKVRRAISALDDMVDEGLIVLSEVDVIKYTHRGAEPVEPDAR